MWHNVSYYLFKMFLVTGGTFYDGTEDIDSTEIFDPDLGSWRTGGALPSPAYGLRAASIDNRVLIFGILILIYDLIRLRFICGGKKIILLKGVLEILRKYSTLSWSMTSLRTRTHRLAP